MVLDDQLQVTAHILHMFPWVDQAIIVFQTHIHGKKSHKGVECSICVWTNEKPSTDGDYKHSPRYAHAQTVS